MSTILRLRRYGHDGCQHDIPIDITINGEPNVGERIMAPEDGEFLLIVDKYPLEAPVEPAVHSDETIGLPSFELRVIRCNEEQLLDSACRAIVHAVNTGIWDVDEEADPDILLN